MSFVEFSFLKPVLLFLIGIFAGICNVMAGGGSLVSMPFLIFLGLDAAVANGTNRLAVAVQNLFAVAGFRKKGYHDWKLSILQALPALPGAALGVYAAVSINEEWFKKILSIVMLLVLVLILTKRSRSNDENEQSHALTSSRKVMILLAFTGIGFYSGFIQAGVGFIFMASMLWLTGMNLVRINAHKVFVIGILTWTAVLLFIFHGKVAWMHALFLASGTALGGWLGSQAAVKGGEKWIRRILIVAVISMSLKLSGLFNILQDFF